MLEKKELKFCYRSRFLVQCYGNYNESVWNDFFFILKLNLIVFSFKSYHQKPKGVRNYLNFMSTLNDICRTKSNLLSYKKGVWVEKGFSFKITNQKYIQGVEDVGKFCRLILKSITALTHIYLGFNWNIYFYWLTWSHPCVLCLHFIA